MRLKKASSVDYVHQFSDLTYMKFRPSKLVSQIQPQNVQENPFVSRIKSFISWRTSDPKNSRVSADSVLSRTSSQLSIKSVAMEGQENATNIVFLEKISPEHFLIGNQNQLDLVCIGGVVGGFVDTQSLWQLNIKKPFKRIAVDTKKGHIAIETDRQILVYSYEPKKLREKPRFICGTKTKTQGKFIRLVRDSLLAVFQDNIVEVYTIEENKIRKKMRKEVLAAQQMELYQVPMPVEGCLNVFYRRRSQTSKTFQLWYMQMTFSGEETKLSELMKIYDIKEGLKLKLENYSKEIFLMNLGFEILAVKRGYIIDSAFLNIQEESTFLHYIGNNRLLHLSPLKAEIYRFRINLTSNPPRIEIDSLDSIEIRKPPKYSFIGALEMCNRNFAVFYQITPHHNIRTRGEITYCFALTRHVTIEEKIREIFTFTPGLELKDVSLETIEQRVDMARKIGLSRTEIYLELWNRTNKTAVEEYKFLLDTLDYSTIKKEIEKKLKKASMPFRQVYKIEQSCFEMIKDNLFSSRCTEQTVKEYLTSHFLLRKLELYRDISLHQKQYQAKESIKEESIASLSEDESVLKINIQSYNKFSKADIKGLFLQLVHAYCFQGKDQLTHLRIFLRSFRFVFRIIYQELLADIVLTAKGALLKLMQNFPQILPYKHMLQENDDSSLYEGVWEDISRNEWDRNLHIEAISTIDNRQIVSEIPQSLWFRRNFLTQHDMTAKSREQILKINRENNSEQIFYFFIDKVFASLEEQDSLLGVIQLLEKGYERMPAHLKEKIFLYRRIYEYLTRGKGEKSPDRHCPHSFHDLLQLKDYQLFKVFFEEEKLRKGCLLKEIKPIYEEVGGIQESYVLKREQIDSDDNYEYHKEAVPGKGITWFNEGLLSYFSSDQSQVSDLKYILNRINNEKREFHIQNERLIQVLVEAVQLKLRVGSGNDVPISQILLYLENIPITPNNPVLDELEKIQKINQEADRFRALRLDMSLKEITLNCQNVINALINEQIRGRNVMNITDPEEMRETSYDIIAEIQIVKEKIYRNEYSDLTFFVYLTKIMEDSHMLPYAAQLLQDEYLVKYFSVDLKVVEDLILYMYKLKLSENPRYVDNEAYLLELLQILPEDNECRTYIHCQLLYAKILSSENNPVEYPLTDKAEGISISQLEERIQELSGDFLLTIPVQKLQWAMNRMQEICYQDFEEHYYTSLNEIYQVLILKLLEENRVVESLPLVRKLLALPGNPFGVVFPLFYIDVLSQELTLECKQNLLRAVAFLFDEPLQLLKIVEELIGKVFTNMERDEYFRQLAYRASQMKKNYNPKNPILDTVYLELIRNEEMEANFREMVEQCGQHLSRTKEEFHTFQYSLIFVMLSQNPYVLAKYIHCRKYHINYKQMRSFLSYVIKQEIFDSLRVLEFGRRLFNIVAEASFSILPLQSIVSQYSTVPMDQTVQFIQLELPEPVLKDDDEIIKKNKLLESKIYKCITAFDRKKFSVLQELTKNGPKENPETKKTRIQRQLTNPIDFSQKAPSEYPFGDSDDDYGQEQKLEELARSARRKKQHQKFNPSLQRNLLMNRTSKNYALFMSNQVSKDDNHLYLSSRNTAGHKKLKSTKTYGLEEPQSLRLSEGFMLDRLSNAQNNRDKGFAQNRSGRVSVEVGLAESIEGFLGSKSALFRERNYSQNGEQIEEQDVQSPLMNVSTKSNAQNRELSQSHTNFNGVDIASKEKTRKDNQFGHQLRVDSRQHFMEEEDVKSDRSRKGSQASFHVYVQQVNENDFMPIEKLKEAIIESVSDSDGGFSVDLSQLSLEEDKDNGGFTEYLQSLIKLIYEESSLKAKTRLLIIKEIQSLYPDIGISKEHLEIYLRFESYHSKYDIAIPMEQMFPIEFVYSETGEPRELFEKVAPVIAQLVDQSNIYKISKIIHLAFKASSFEQEFFFSYLCIACEKYDVSPHSASQLDMHYQKLAALIQKLPVNVVLEKGKEMVAPMAKRERKEAIVEAMVSLVSKKKSEKEAQIFRESMLSGY